MKKILVLIGVVLMTGFTSCKKQECKKLLKSYEEATIKREICTYISFDDQGNEVVVYEDCFSHQDSKVKGLGKEYVSKCADDTFL